MNFKWIKINFRLKTKDDEDHLRYAARLTEDSAFLTSSSIKLHVLPWLPELQLHSMQTARQSEQNWHGSATKQKERDGSSPGEERWPISRYSAHMPRPTIRCSCSRTGRAPRRVTLISVHSLADLPRCTAWSFNHSSSEDHDHLYLIWEKKTKSLVWLVDWATRRIALYRFGFSRHV